MKHLTDEQLILYYYGEAEDQWLVGDHLASCSECRAILDALKLVLAKVGSTAVPERPEAYGALVWQRLQTRLYPPARSGWLWLLHPPRWAFAGSLVVLVVAAFLLGRFWPGPEIQIARPGVLPVSERILLASVADHLESTQMVLLELVNTSGNGSVDISVQQMWAKDLVAANRLYRQSAARGGEVGVANILDELERVLLEITHSPSRLTSTELDEIRQRIDAQGILFKIRVLGAQVREREKTVARELARRTL